MNWFTVGSLTVPASQLAVLAAFIIAGLAVWLKKDKGLLDFYGNSVFLFVALWKASVVLFSFQLVIQAPLSLLYFNGGWKGIWLGLIAVCIYIIWKCPSEKWVQAAWIWMVFIFSYELVFPVLTGQAGIWTIIQLAGGLLLAVPLGQISRTIWLFTLWQLLFESLTAELFSQSSLLYVGMALFFGLITRRDFIE